MDATADQVSIESDLRRLHEAPELQEAGAYHIVVNFMLIRVFRYLCRNQAWLDVVPIADGSNLFHSHPFRFTFSWFKRWLSVCHYQQVTRQQINDPAYIAETTIRLEKRGRRLTQIEDETKKSRAMQPFRKLYDHQSAALALWGLGPVADLEPDCYILADLLYAEYEFEQALDGTHVEDVLLEKRFDRDWLNDLQYGDPLTEIRAIHEHEREGWWIRQLRQHGFRRPWKQLYHVVDDTSSQEDAQAIDLVASHFREPRTERAVDVQPIALSAMRDKTCAVMCGRHDDDDAGTSADFGEDDTVMLPFCGLHWIHATCAFAAWDVLGQNKFSFPCPMCRRDPGRISDKLQIEVPEGNFNVGFDPEKDQADAFAIIQAMLFDDFTMLERQHEFPAVARRKALREQARLLAYADEQDRYYDNVIANWQPNPQNPTQRRPDHPRNREQHDQEYFPLYDFDQDDNPPRYAEAHAHEDAITMIEDGMRVQDLPAIPRMAWQQWLDRGGFEEIVANLQAVGRQVNPLLGLALIDNNDPADFGGGDDDDDGADDDADDGADGADDVGHPMPDADDDDGGDDGNRNDPGQGGNQNAFARWKKVDTVKTTAARQMSRGSRAAKHGQ